MRSRTSLAWRKWMQVSFAVALAVAVLAACAGGQPESPSGNATTGGTTVGGEAGGASAADAGGAPAQAEPLHIKMFAGLYNELPEMDNPYWTEWQKRTNTKLEIEWVPSGDLNTKLDLMLASGDLPEVVSSPDVRPPLVSAIKNGAFWDLTPFLGDFSEYPNLKNNLAQDWQKYLSVDGKIYGLPRSRSRVDLGVKIRKDWLDKLGIPVPTTLDEYKEALKRIVSGDPDGNGQHDTLGLIGHGVIIDDGDMAFGAAFGAMDPYFDEEGGFRPPELTPGYADMLEWFRGLYAEGALAKEFAVMKKTQAEELYKTGRAASYVRSVWWDKEYEDAIGKTQPDPQIVNLALEGPKGVTVELATGVSGGYFISKKVPEEKVKQILAYLELTASEELTDLAYYGIEGVHHTVVDGQKVLNELGVREVNTTSKGAGVLAYAKWGKVESASGSKAYNDAKKEEVGKFDEIGKINPMTGLYSESWLKEWPKHANEHTTMVTRAIVGQITMDEYRAFVDRISGTPEMKRAFQELAESYKALNGE